jgi:hypothetical protein
VIATLVVSMLVQHAAAKPPGPEYEESAYICTDTTVKSIGSRLTDGDGKPMPNMGSAVAFASGLSLVDYETPKVVELQRVGDKVQVCLIAVPQNCPKGDDRGKLYRVFDYRQKASYEMADSQHMCGGA